jgi:sialidase-1
MANMTLMIGLVLAVAANAFGAEAGFAVDVFPAGDAFQRNSEGSIIELPDGRLFLMATRFYGGSADHAKANLVARTSGDGGKTWSEPVVVQENIAKQNVMSVSLVRLAAPTERLVERTLRPIGMFFLIKNGPADLKVVLRISSDETKNWSDPICVTDRPGYHVMNNDRVVRLGSGRLLCPVSFSPDSNQVNHYKSLCFLSDDRGKTWHAGRGEVDLPKRGAMEPEVIECRDGSLLMLMRTQLGRNYATRSKDGGETWSDAEPFGPPAPEAPSTLRRIPSTGDWLLIFNPSLDPKNSHGGRRTPLAAAVSADEGKTWQHQRNIESRDDQTYSYISLIFVNDRAVISYYVDEQRLTSLRFRSVPIDWFYGK